MFADFSAKVEQLNTLQQLELTELAAVNKLLTEVQMPIVFAPPKKNAATTL